MRRAILLLIVLILGMILTEAALSEEYEFIAMWPKHSQQWSLRDPHGITIDPSGSVYVADTGNHCIKKFSSNGELTAKWGTRGRDKGQFSSPCAVVVDSKGNVYVVDRNNCRIQKLSAKGEFITEWGSSGEGDGEFKYPSGIAIDSSGNVYIADSSNLCIKKFTSEGKFISKLSRKGDRKYIDYFGPSDIAIDSSDNVYQFGGHNSGNSGDQFGANSGDIYDRYRSRKNGDFPFHLHRVTSRWHYPSFSRLPYEYFLI